MALARHGFVEHEVEDQLAVELLDAALLQCLGKHHQVRLVELRVEFCLEDDVALQRVFLHRTRCPQRSGVGVVRAEQMESGHAGNQFQAGRRRHCHLLSLTIHWLVGREVIDIEAEESFAAWCGGELLQSGLQGRIHWNVIALVLYSCLAVVVFLAAAGSEDKEK